MTRRLVPWMNSFLAPEFFFVCIDINRIWFRVGSVYLGISGGDETIAPFGYL